MVGEEYHELIFIISSSNVRSLTPLQNIDPRRKKRKTKEKQQKRKFTKTSKVIDKIRS